MAKTPVKRKGPARGAKSGRPAGKKILGMGPLPLNLSLYGMILFCWILPLTATLLFSSYQTERNTRVRIENTILSSASHGASILEERFAEAMEDSRAASYDGVILQAYEDYLLDGDQVALYGSANAYLTNQYAHNSLFEAVYLIYPDVPDTPVYIFNGGAQGTAGTARDFENQAMEQILARGRELGTRIDFLPIEGRLYMVRNIVDSRFETQAVLIMQCSQEYLFEGVGNLVWSLSAGVELDGTYIPAQGGDLPEIQPGLRYDRSQGAYLLNQELDVEGHEVRMLAEISGGLLAQERLNFRVTMFLMILVSGGLLILLVHFFFQNISRPVEDLVEAMEHLERGQLGYHVQGKARNQEFKYLNARFDDLSDQLKEQFERNNMEQIALHDARIKALQSQINPHFLNNTLELINWEARMADDKKVCQMIEALSVMLNAAMARGGSATVNMREELSYIDAYLYIISQRFGDRLTVKRDIQAETLEAEVPRLILQPIVENAIEHGIASRSKSELVIHIFREENWLILDVEHDGCIMPETQKTIDRLLHWDGTEQSMESSAHIGIRNVNQRLKILYGPDSGLTLGAIRPSYIRSRIRLPFIPSGRERAEFHGA